MPQDNIHIQTILDNLFTYVALLDISGRVLEINLAPLIRGGYQRDAVIGQYFYDAPWWSYSDAVRTQLMLAIEDAKQGQSSRYDVKVMMGEELVPLDFQISPIFDQDGKVTGMVPTAVDITVRKKIEEKLALSEEQHRFVLEGSELGFWDWNIVTGEVDRNHRWAEMLGYSFEEIKHTTQQWTDFIHPDDRDKAWQSIRAVLEGRSPLHKIEYRMLHKDGSIRWILDQAKVMRRDKEGKPIRMSGTHADITERKMVEIELQKRAQTDFLTGLFNRGHFLEKAELELKRSLRYGSHLTILVLDIDFFKQINDTHGHKSGDLVLQKLAHICLATLREVDIVGRMGGEEFAVLLPETDKVKALEVAERLRVAIESTNVPIEHGVPIHFTVSLGITSKASAEDNLDYLLSQADNALYESKRLGRNRVSVVGLRYENSHQENPNHDTKTQQTLPTENYSN